MSAQMEQLIAQFEHFQAKVRHAEARFAEVGDMQERIARLETTVTSPSGEVTVVAGRAAPSPTSGSARVPCASKRATCPR